MHSPHDKKPLTNLLQPAAATDTATDTGRRRFVRQMAWGATALGTLPLAACGGSDDPEVRFVHGVASGDPLSDRVILWTRVTPATGATARRGCAAPGRRCPATRRRSRRVRAPDRRRRRPGPAH